MKELRIGIIGTGIIAHEHLRSYRNLKGVKVVAACDLIKDKLDSFCKEYDIPDSYADYRELLARDDIDAVDICVHNNLHTPLTIATLKSGKHCYCEKPMAGSYIDAVAMYNAAEEYGKKLHIQLSTLYHKESHAAKKLIADGKLGKIYHSRSYGYRRRGRPFVDGYAEKEFNSKYWAAGGALFDMGVYHISLILYLLNLPKITRVSGNVYQEIPMHEGRRKEGGFDVEELGVGFVKFADGSSLDILESWAIHSGEFQPSVIAGSQGGLTIGNGIKYYTEMSGYPVTTLIDVDSEVYRTHQIDPELSMFDNSVAHWVGALSGKCELINTADIALATMLISEGIYMSSERGCDVSAEEIARDAVSKAIRSQKTDFGTLEYVF